MVRYHTIVVVAVATASASLPGAAAEGPGVGQSRTFSDWVVGCDNFANCVALGFPVGDSDGGIAYLRIARSGAADAKPEVKVVASLDGDGVKPGPRKLALSLLGAETPLATDVLDFKYVDGYAEAPVQGDTSSFLSALLPAAELVVGSRDMTQDAQISLKGLSAALRAMDDRQGRVDTVSALVARGSLGLDAVPPVPALPAPIKVVKLLELDPVPPLPDGVEKPTEECEMNPAPVAYEAANGSKIFGTCVFEGAYNVGMHYTLVSGKKTSPLEFDLGAGPDDDKLALTNGGLDEDGNTLSAFDKGRGVGDCGTISSWAFDGKAFQLVSFTAMTICRGAMPQDWPVLYTGATAPAAGE